MRAWANLNTKGRILWCCCVMNVFISVVFALDSNICWAFSLLMGMFCGLSTYDPRYNRK